MQHTELLCYLCHLTMRGSFFDQTPPLQNNGMIIAQISHKTHLKNSSLFYNLPFWTVKWSKQTRTKLKDFLWDQKVFGVDFCCLHCFKCDISSTTWLWGLKWSLGCLGETSRGPRRAPESIKLSKVCVCFGALRRWRWMRLRPTDEQRKMRRNKKWMDADMGDNSNE